MRDYSACYSPRMRRRQPPKKSWRASSRALTPVRQSLFWKVIGVVVGCALIVALIGSFWLGHSIQQGLEQIRQAREVQGRQQQLQTDLRQQRQQVLEARKFEAIAAVKVGLRQPEKGQTKDWRPKKARGVKGG